MSLTTRTVYHTYIKYLAYHDLLSSDILQRIPRSHLARWKREHPDRYQSFELNRQACRDYELIHHFAHSPSARRVYAAYVRILKTVLSVAHALPGFHRAVKSQARQVVSLVERVKNTIGLKRALRLFNISVPTFRNWSAQTMTLCFESFTGNYNRVFHNQLSRPEIVKLREMLADKQFQYWPVSSIALYALRNNILPLSLNTWYKYVNKFGLARPKPHLRKKKNEVSVRAERPHQIWHADITQFVSGDHAKHYIYIVIDNFSLKILSWEIADAVKAEIRKSTIEVALVTVNGHHTSITLVTDGGPENRLQDLVAALEQSVDHKIALVDVHYSNSLIEANNKIIKYNYLYRMHIPNGKHLRSVFPSIVDHYNNRSHGSLHGLTPNEAEQNFSLDRGQLRLNTSRASEESRKYNRIHHCKPCKT